MIRCVTLTRYCVSRWQYWQGAVYKAYTTQDGRVVWKKVYKVAEGRRSYKLADEDAKRYASKNGLPFLEDVKQWQPICPATLLKCRLAMR